MVAGSLAGGGHAEAGAARPVHLFADQRRLVAVSEAVHHPRGGGARGQQRPGDDIGLHRDHHHVAARVDRRHGVPQPGAGIAGRFHHHLDAVGGNHPLAVIPQVGPPAVPRRRRRWRRELLGLPAGRRQQSAHLGHVAVGDRHHVDARRAPRLRQKHRAELAGADHPHPRRPPLGRPPLQTTRQIHPAPLTASPLTTTSLPRTLAASADEPHSATAAPAHSRRTQSRPVRPVRRCAGRLTTVRGRHKVARRALRQ